MGLGRDQDSWPCSRKNDGRVNGARTDKWHIALYSHDTVGLGHMRRNMLIADAIISSKIPASVLLIGGAREACAFSLPHGMDWLTLPSFQKNAQGTYQTRSLDVTLEELVALRSKIIASALDSFAPDVFIVDKRPRGALRELDASLESLRARGRTRLVLGLRDVLDDPARIRQEWCDDENESAVHDFYDAIWVYGDPALYDQAKEYGYPASVTSKIRHTGYLVRSGLRNFSEAGYAEPTQLGIEPDERVVLCTMGGGQDGGLLAEAFAQISFLPKTKAVILSGPFMPAHVEARLRSLAADNDRLQVIHFLSDVDWLLKRADAIVAMGGYNTVWEAVYLGKRTLIVPRVHPRQEQLIRAERLQHLGLVEVLPPNAVTPAALSAWLNRVHSSPVPEKKLINFDGCTNLLQYLGEMLGDLRLNRSRQLERRPEHALR